MNKTIREISDLDLDTVGGGFGMQDVGPATRYYPSGSGGGIWRNTLTGRAVNVQNGGPPNQGTRVP
jgi:hypothetical protein